MAAIASVVAALARCGWRSLRGAFAANNLIAVIALLMAEEPLDRPSSTALLFLVIGLLWTMPLAQELTRRIPDARFRLWPLTNWQKAAIFGANLLLNPLIVMALLFGALSRHPAVRTGLLTAGLSAPFAALLIHALAGRGSAPNPLRSIPLLPGKLGGLILSHLREFVQFLDYPLAALLALGGILYGRSAEKADLSASLVIGVLIVILMSTCAQRGVGFDAEGRSRRTRLLPLSGAEVVFARDAAWFLALLPLIAGFRFAPCCGAALGALVAGHRAANGIVEQQRWHFSTGDLRLGAVQIVILILAASAVEHFGSAALLGVATIYAGSVWWTGREWERARSA